MSRFPRHPAVLPSLLLVLALSACGPFSSSSSATSTATTSDLAAVTVSGASAAKPTVKVPVPFSVTTTTRRVLTAGSGAKLTLGQRVSVQYVGVNGADGKEFDTSWDTKATTFVLNTTQNLPGLVTGLVGTKVGSRVLVAIPPKDGYGVSGSSAAGIGPTDTLVIVVDVISAHSVLSQATGKTQTAKKGLPTVTRASNGKPKITVPSSTAPSSLQVQALIVGTGAKVTKGESITVQYTGVIWASGKQFDSSWDRGQSSTFQIGAGKVITGWDTGLVGQTVGSQVLLVIPPGQGYGSGGNSTAGIKGTDTLVFVVDILDAS